MRFDFHFILYFWPDNLLMFRYAAIIWQEKKISFHVISSQWLFTFTIMIPISKTKTKIKTNIYCHAIDFILNKHCIKIIFMLLYYFQWYVTDFELFLKLYGMKKILAFKMIFAIYIFLKKLYLYPIHHFYIYYNFFFNFQV